MKKKVNKKETQSEIFAFALLEKQFQEFLQAVKNLKLEGGVGKVETEFKALQSTFDTCYKTVVNKDKPKSETHAATKDMSEVMNHYVKLKEQCEALRSQLEQDMGMGSIRRSIEEK